MSAGRHWKQELYVGFLLLTLSFLYLSHLTQELQLGESKPEIAAVRAPQAKKVVAKEQASSITLFM